MDIYRLLNQDIQTHILRMHMSHNVFPELLSNKHLCFCMSCACNGLPCFNCAIDRFCGILGPGLHNGCRVIFTGHDYENDKWVNIITYLKYHQVCVKLFRNIDDMEDVTRFTPSLLSLHTIVPC